jgi:hypothetical protein
LLAETGHARVVATNVVVARVALGIDAAELVDVAAERASAIQLLAALPLAQANARHRTALAVRAVVGGLARERRRRREPHAANDGDGRGEGQRRREDAALSSTRAHPARGYYAGSLAG